MFVAERHKHLIGQIIGTGHCVPFVREVTGAPRSTDWRRGDRVRDVSPPPGTAIATFDDDGNYPSHTDGRSHAAILIAVTSNGLLVADQWQGQPVHERVIRYRDGVGDAANDGDQFFIVEIET